LLLMAQRSFLTLTEVSAIVAGVWVLAVVYSIVFSMGNLERGRMATVMFWVSLLAIGLGAIYVAAVLRGAL
jgi:hypothetical protein